MIVLRQRDSVSMATFDDQIRELVRESGNPSHLRRLTDVLQSAVSERRSAIGPALHEFSQRVKRRGVVVLISDLLGDVDALLSGLKHLRHSRHEVLVLQTLDPAETEFPFDRTTLFKGLESLPQVLAEPRGVRQAYLEEFRKFVDRLSIGCRSLNVQHELLPTDRPFDEALRRVLTRRSH